MVCRKILLSKIRKELKGYTVEDMKKIMDQYINVDEMNYIIVGDAETQLEGVKSIQILKKW